jgi:hypothetical protein
VLFQALAAVRARLVALEVIALQMENE